MNQYYDNCQSCQRISLKQSTPNLLNITSQNKVGHKRTQIGVVQTASAQVPQFNVSELFPQGLNLKNYSTEQPKNIAQNILQGNAFHDILKVNRVRERVQAFLQKQGIILENKKGNFESLTTQYFDLIHPKDELHPVQSIIQDRMRSNSKPLARKDNFKVGLVVEGGGMKGAVTGAMLQQLSEMGIKDCFDIVYGSSAGAINSTYYLSDQVEACNIYTEDICNKEFLDLMRLINFDRPGSDSVQKKDDDSIYGSSMLETQLLRDSLGNVGQDSDLSKKVLKRLQTLDTRDEDYYGKTYGYDEGTQSFSYVAPKDNKLAVEAFNQVQKQSNPSLNLDILLDKVMETVKPLDYQKVLQSKIPLKAVSSSLTVLDSVLLQNFKDKEQLKRALKASACVPVVAGEPIQYDIDGLTHELVDAAVFEIIPFVSALREGCTHTLVLCSRPPNLGNFYLQSLNMLIELAVKNLVLSPAYMKKAWQQEALNTRQFGMLQEDILLLSLIIPDLQQNMLAECQMLPVYPGSIADYPVTCIDRETIQLGMEEGRRVIQKVMEKVIP